MKQKSGGIKRLMEFTGKHRGLLTVSRLLSCCFFCFMLTVLLPADAHGPVQKTVPLLL